MWVYIVRHILRNRLGNLIAILLVTAFMAYQATQVKMSYEFSSLLPASDTASIVYSEFKERFGQDGSVLFIGFEDKDFFELDKFADYYDLTYDIKNIDGVEEVISVPRLFYLSKDTALKKFDFKPVIDEKPTRQSQVDSVRKLVYSLPFYDGLLLNKESHVFLMAITLEQAKLNNKNRIKLVNAITGLSDIYGDKYQLQPHYSGLPYIRIITSKKLEEELLFFVKLALIIASVILLLFFKSFKAMFFPMLIVIVSIIWGIGIMSLLGFKITMLTGIFPPLLMVIVVENCIFLLNKYYSEFKSHGNKVRSLSRVVQRIGSANLLTNATTAAGFAAFIVTGNKLLVEFGIVASLSILSAYILSLMLIPIFFSYLPPPKAKHFKHLDKGMVKWIVNHVVYTVQNYRTTIYITTSVLLVAAVFGMLKLETTGSIVDDIPKEDALYKDLMFFEENFKGVMPLEISIDTKKRKGVMKLSTIKRINKLQRVLTEYPELSKPLSIAEVVKFSKQAFYGGKESMYSIPNNQEKDFIFSYAPKMENGKKTIMNSFVDSTLQYTRISTQMANIGTYDIQRIQDELKPRIDSIFPPAKFDVQLTGTSLVFLKGTKYLVNNLFTSLLLALVIITILMALLFTSIRMILISLVPNIIPLLMTAAMMGFTGISIKPSTVLIFSIALGISVDNAIHFLSRYRLQLKLNDWRIKDSAIAALSETGFSMIYSSIVLFFGFIIFTLSTFGGTEAMGYLIAFTLVVALFSNLFLLPSLILSLDQRITTRRFKDPLLEIFDEEEDIELSDLEIEQIDTRGSA